MTSSARPSRHLWLPGVESKGGIQTYGSFLIEALREVAPEADHEFLLKNDAAPPPSASRWPRAGFRTFGRVPPRLRTPAFAAGAVLRAARDRPDHLIAVHLHFAPLCERVCRVIGARWWVIAHGIEAWSIGEERIRDSLRRADRIIAVSRYTRDRLQREQSLDPEKFRILPNTFDAEAYRPRPRSRSLLFRHGIEADQPVLLTVARLESRDRRKGYDEMLEALPRIQSAVPDVHYLLVGDGPDRPRVERRVRELGLEGAVTLAGMVADEALPAYYTSCDAFVMPSTKEGFGIVFLEAIACGRPVIAGDRDGSRDPLMDGELGVLVDPTDTDEIADAAVRLLRKDHPNRLLFDPEGLRERVVEEFGPARFRDRLRELLAEAGSTA